MTRLYDNLVSGTLGVALTDIGTTLTSAQLQSLIEVSGGNTVTIILDPLNEQNGSEIVHVTAHGFEAVTATIVREAEAAGQFAKRAHPLGTNWTHGVTVEDLEGFRDHTHAAPTIAHDDTTGITTDNHHSEDHAVRHKTGGADPLEYLHPQPQASDTWVISHNLSKRPAVTVVDSTDREVVGDIKYDSDNQITITFSAGFSGEAYLT